MPNVKEKLMVLARQLYPKGRVFRMPKFGYLEKLHTSVNEVHDQAYNDAYSIYYSLLPDNDNFTEEDATDWERRLGMKTNSLVSLEDRKAAILRKLRYPGTNPAKQHYLYIESQLQLANFDVYVYENRFPDYPDGYITKTPMELGAPVDDLTYIRHGQILHGQGRHGYVYNKKIANYIDEEKDLPFSVGSNLRSTFFISGNPIGSAANIPIARKDEFRELVLRIKPVQTVALLLNINYV